MSASRRWQFHLSTLLIMMPVAGVVIWLNTISRPTAIGESFGWPQQFMRQHPAIIVSFKPGIIKASRNWDFTAIAVDVAVLIAVVVATGAAAEFVARRRAR